jgi:hypothetical protein
MPGKSSVRETGHGVGGGAERTAQGRGPLITELNGLGLLARRI